MKNHKIFLYVFVVIFFILCWQFFIFVKNYYLLEGTTSIEAFVPSPYTVLKTIYFNWRVLLIELGYTLSRALLGLVLGTLAAIFANTIFFLRPKVKKIVLPLSMAINSFPIMGFSPLIILAFGQGSWLGIVFISALISYFPILISLEKALSLVSIDFYELGKIWKASSLSVFTHIQLPLVMPYVIGSLKMAIPASIVGATLGEWLGTSHGIGRLVVIALYQLNPGLLYSSLLIILISSLTITWFSTIIEKKYFPWTEKNHYL